MNFEKPKDKNIGTPEIKTKEGVNFVFEQNISNQPQNNQTKKYWFKKGYSKLSPTKKYPFYPGTIYPISSEGLFLYIGSPIFFLLFIIFTRSNLPISLYLFPNGGTWAIYSLMAISGIGYWIILNTKIDRSLEYEYMEMYKKEDPKKIQSMNRFKNILGVIIIIFFIMLTLVLYPTFQ